MILRTKVQVTHIDVENMPIGATNQGIVEMHLGGRLFVSQPDGSSEVQIEYRYVDSQGRILPTSDGGKKVISGDVSAISQSLGNTGVSFVDHFNADVSAFAISEFAARFGLEVSDIEIMP